jgi:hypothetical protein
MAVASGHDQQANDSYCFRLTRTALTLTAWVKANNLRTKHEEPTHIPMSWWKHTSLSPIFLSTILLTKCTLHYQNILRTSGISQFSHLHSISAFSVWPVFKLCVLTDRLIQGISYLSTRGIRGRVSRWHHSTRLRRKPLPVVVNIMILSVTLETKPYFIKRFSYALRWWQ